MPAPIRLHTWPTPNGHKLHILLEELGLPYEVVPVNIGAGAQFASEFLAITPNHRIPAIEDPDGPDGRPLALFESGAIMIYLCEKTGSPLLPSGGAARAACMQWLMFQMGGVGPMFGQYNHFAAYAPEELSYPIERYGNEVARLHRVLEKRLSQAPFLAGDYSIADIATFPWVRNPERRGVDLDDYPAIRRWHDAIAARPAVQRGVAVLAENQRKGAISERERENMFGATQFQAR
jgi:GST-like protein